MADWFDEDMPGQSDGYEDFYIIKESPIILQKRDYLKYLIDNIDASKLDKLEKKLKKLKINK